jgi:hypothetical protein
MLILWNNATVSLWRWILDKIIVKIQRKHARYPLLHQHRQVNWKRHLAQLHETMSGFIKIAGIQTNEDTV